MKSIREVEALRARLAVAADAARRARGEIPALPQALPPAPDVTDAELGEHVALAVEAGLLPIGRSAFVGDIPLSPPAIGLIRQMIIREFKNKGHVYRLVNGALVRALSRLTPLDRSYIDVARRAAENTRAQRIAARDAAIERATCAETERDSLAAELNQALAERGELPAESPIQSKKGIKK